jgi:hypothetical protein
MAGFVARWLSDAVRIGLPLVLALAAMQVPALAHGYATALLQIAEDARRDIEQRKASARQFYRGAAGTDEAVIAALRDVEPANAQALAASVERARALRAAHDRIEAAAPLLREDVVFPAQAQEIAVERDRVAVALGFAPIELAALEAVAGLRIGKPPLHLRRREAWKLAHEGVPAVANEPRQLRFVIGEVEERRRRLEFLALE